MPFVLDASAALEAAFDDESGVVGVAVADPLVRDVRTGVHLSRVVRRPAITAGDLGVGARDVGRRRARRGGGYGVARRP